MVLAPKKNDRGEQEIIVHRSSFFGANLSSVPRHNQVPTLGLGSSRLHQYGYWILLLDSTTKQ